MRYRNKPAPVKVEMPTDPRRTRPGYHLVRVNDKTQIEVKDGQDDVLARQMFVDKMHQLDRAFYNNLEVTEG